MRPQRPPRPRGRAAALAGTQPPPRHAALGSRLARGSLSHAGGSEQDDMTWKRVCAAVMLGDRDLKQFEVDGVQILLVRSGEDFFAFPPLCPHQAGELEISGICDGEVLTCSKHLWQWNIRTGKEVGEAERPLLQYNTRVEHGEVHVFIERELRYDYD